jgi:hypothetical protein
MGLPVLSGLLYQLIPEESSAFLWFLRSRQAGRGSVYVGHPETEQNAEAGLGPLILDLSGEP